MFSASGNSEPSNMTDLNIGTSPRATLTLEIWTTERKYPSS
jgi:hypothetical protein